MAPATNCRSPMDQVAPSRLGPSRRRTSRLPPGRAMPARSRFARPAATALPLCPSAASTTTPRFRSAPAQMPRTARLPPAAAAPATMKCFCATEARDRSMSENEGGLWPALVSFLIARKRRMSHRAGHRVLIGRHGYEPRAVVAALFDLGRMRETCREEIDEGPGFRRQKVAVRIDGIDRRFLRLVVGQKADQLSGVETVGNEIVRTEQYSRVLERQRQQQVAAVRGEAPGNTDDL